MSNKKFFVQSLIHLVGSLLIIAVVVFSSLYPPAVLRVEGQRERTFSSYGLPIEFGAFNALCKALRIDGTIEVTLQSQFVEVPTIQNFFQTSGYNRGIRVEVDQRGDAGVVIGAATKKGFFSLELGPLGPNSAFVVALQLQRDRLRFRINDSEFGTWLSTPTLTPQCDSFVVGGGFDGLRQSFAPVRMIANVVSIPNDSFYVRLSRLASKNLVRLMQMTLLILILTSFARLLTRNIRRANER